MNRRSFLGLAAATAALAPLSQGAWAQGYPTRPVRIIVGFAAGGGSDIVARLLAQWLSSRLGQQFLVENRPGAGSNLGTEAVVRASADGYTLLLVSAANTISAALYDNLNFNFLRDIAPIGNIISAPNVMVVSPSVPAKTVPEFIAYAKANPGKIAMASNGNGTPSQLAGELFKMMTGINVIEVPYRGGSLSLTDLLGGQVQLYFGAVSSTVEYVKAGKLRALAVTTSVRSASLPDTPTVSEFLPGYEASSWYGVGAPKDTPDEIINVLSKEINAALADPQMRARLGELGSPASPSSPADFDKFIADETDKWSKVVKFAGIKAE